MFINKKTAVYLLIAVFLLIIDRFLKTYCYLNQELSYNIIGEIFQLNFALNPYIAFSLPITGLILNFFVLFILWGLLVIIKKFYCKKEYNLTGPLIMIFLGGASNLYDRFKYRAVIDYFDLEYFTIFNLADTMIVLSAFWLLFKLSRQQ